jgi:putative transcriptional regulator
MRSSTRTPVTTAAPTHHVSEEGLLEYVAGAATDPASLAIACHVSLCAACAAQAAALEAVGGSILETSPGEPLDAGALQATLARLDAAPEPAAVARGVVEAPGFLSAFGLPSPLLRSLPAQVADWRFVVPGVRAVDLPVVSTGATARLICFGGGVTIPLHDHGGTEYVVVFSGALEEKADGKRFGRGDISIRQTGERHEQRATPGEACIALVVNEGKLRPLTLRGRLLLALAR